jgi:hypothetical protein
MSTPSAKPGSTTGNGGLKVSIKKRSGGKKVAITVTKKCSYCGAEYAGDITACPVDQNPLIDSVQAASPVSRKLPVPLLIVSYLFLIPAGYSFIRLVQMIGVISTYPSSISDLKIIGCLIWLLAIGLFFFRIFMGLRRCSRFWRVFAFLVIGICLASGLYGFVVESLKFHDQHQVMPATFILGYSFSMILTSWPLFVLTRRDVRELFQNDLA